MNVLAQIRTIETATLRMKADQTRIQELEQRKQTTADEIAGATKDLVLALAAQKGLLRLSPTQIVAVFEEMMLPKVEEPVSRTSEVDNTMAPGRLAVDAFMDATVEYINQLDADELVEATVEYTSYKKGLPKVALVEAVGLKRGAPFGFWSGRVDREAMARLTHAFPGKVKVKVGAIHSQSNPMPVPTGQVEAASEGLIMDVEATPEVGGSGNELAISSQLAAMETENNLGLGADNLEFAIARPQGEARPVVASIPRPRQFPQLPKRFL